MTVHALSKSVEALPRDKTVAQSHPRHAVPFTVTIDGRTYAGDKISVVEMLVDGEVPHAGTNDVKQARLTLPLDGFDVVVDADVRVMAIVAGRSGMIFAAPYGAHRATLDSVLNGVIAGDLVTVDRVLRSRNRIVEKTGNAHPVRRRNVFGTALRGTALAALGLGLAAFVGHQLWERVLTTPPAGAAYVASSSVVVAAPVSGQLASVDADAAIGTPVFSVLSNAGRLVSVDMPCDCRVLSQNAQTGSSVAADERVVVLVPKTAEAHVEAQVDQATLRGLYSGTRARVTMPDGTTVSAVPFDLPRIASAPAEGEMPVVKLRPETPIASDAVGTPVDVSFTNVPDLGLGDIGRRISSIFRTNEAVASPTERSPRF